MRALVAQLRQALQESTSRYCGFWPDTNGKWYMDLADDEYGDYEDADTYGPFASEEAADKYLRANFSNPGGADVSPEGKDPPPTKAPNGTKVQSPKSRSW